MADLKLPSEQRRFSLAGLNALMREGLAGLTGERLPSRSPAEKLLEADDPRITMTVERMKQAEISGVPLLEMAEREGITIRFEPLRGMHGYYSPRHKEIVLDGDSRLSAESLGLTLVHELRHAWQHAEGLLPTAALDAHSYIAAIRYIEADAKATEAQFLAEVAQQPDGMDYVGKVDKPNTRDVIAVFNNELRNDPDALTNGKARFAAFMQWPEPSAHRAQGYEERAAGNYRAWLRRGVNGRDRLSYSTVSRLGQHSDSVNFILDTDEQKPRPSSSVFTRNFVQLLTQAGKDIVRDSRRKPFKPRELPAESYRPEPWIGPQAPGG